MIHKDLLDTTYLMWTDFLKRQEQATPEKIQSDQLIRLKNMITYAYRNCKGYRELYTAHNITPQDLNCLDDIQKFPTISKEDIRDHLEDFSVPLIDRSYITTGGSTGIPFGMYRDISAFHRELASKAHQYRRIGWREGDPQVVLRGIPINTLEHMEFVPEFNELRCSSYHLVPGWIDLFLKRIKDYKPLWLRCYPSSGCILAQWLMDTGETFPPLKGILCASENLYDFQKELLKETFKTRVFSHYGHYELAALAGFCEYEDTYHVLPSYGYAELLDQDNKPITQPGQSGEIVATSFIMYATPMIRYRTRDIARLKGWQCPSCKRPYQIWDHIEGRLQEFIVTKDNRRISMTALNFHTNIFDQLKQFQFYQDTPGVVEMHVIPKKEPINWEPIKNGLQTKLTDMEIIFKTVTDIPLTIRGKHRFLIQKLDLLGHDA